MEEAIPTLTEAPVEQEAEATLAAPTKSVDNFWERLDKVFTQNSKLKEQMDELLEQFPDFEKSQQDYKSYIFQPERIALCSNDDITGNRTTTNDVQKNEGHLPAESFSSFRIRLNRPLRNIKSIQLLSGVIPNATQNLPDNQLIFFYYRIRTLATANKGAWSAITIYNAGDIVTFLGNTFVCLLSNQNYQPVGGQLGIWWNQINIAGIDTNRPNYYDINPEQIQTVWMLPTFGIPPEVLGNYGIYNRTFTGYADLIQTLNICANAPETASIPGDVKFVYNEQLNKIQFIGNSVNIDAPNNYYYLPCGYEDPNISTAMLESTQIGNRLFLIFGEYTIKDIYSPGYTLNLRLGFTWNGVISDPLQTINNPYAPGSLLPSALYWYLRAVDSGAAISLEQNILTANSYADLVNTSCVRIYADFALGSTQDSLGSASASQIPVQQGLLSIVPVNANNLGVGFYQNNFNNALTKIPQNLTEIGITMLNDQGLPYFLPNSATVLLELALEYR